MRPQVVLEELLSITKQIGFLDATAYGRIEREASQLKIAVSASHSEHLHSRGTN
jgi:hypothetical protein